MKYSPKKKTPKEQLVKFLEELGTTARTRLAGAKIAMGDKIGDDLERSKRYAFKTAGVFIYADYEQTEQSGVHDAYEITFSFDYLAKIRGKRKMKAVVPIFMDKGDNESIEDVVLGTLEVLGDRINSGLEGMYVSGPCCKIINDDTTKIKQGIIIYYLPEEIINYKSY
jgi:hypothetical protein